MKYLSIISKYLIIVLTALAFSVYLYSCKDDPEEPPMPEAIRQTTLIYAVNHNNLSSDLAQNQRQMLEAFKKSDSSGAAILLYRTDTNDECGLYQAVLTWEEGVGRSADWELIKKYDRNIPSTDPSRIRKVIEDALEMYDTQDNNLFFWGHGTAWTPENSGHILKSRQNIAPTEKDAPEAYGFGGENMSNGTDWTNIDELASAVPDGKFDLIWFDCCYMSSIETAYQFRNKCNKYVAYPTEIAGEGLPYNQILPFIFKSEKDLESAALALYKHYDRQNTCVTVAVWDMSAIEDVASCARDIFASGSALPSKSDLYNYSRHDPYYDFGQYMRNYASANGASDLIPGFENALRRLIIRAYASERDFKRQPIPVENFSGVNVHYFTEDNTSDDEYYRSLDWYKATRMNDHVSTSSR